jgi:hypothetical protein
MQSIQKLTHFGPALKPPSRRDTDQLDAALGPLRLQFTQKQLDAIGAQRIVEQSTKLAHGHRLLGANQGSFEDTLGIRRIHFS